MHEAIRNINMYICQYNVVIIELRSTYIEPVVLQKSANVDWDNKDVELEQRVENDPSQNVLPALHKIFLQV